MWLVINAQIYAVMRAFHITIGRSRRRSSATAAAVLGPCQFRRRAEIGPYQAAVQHALTRSFYGVALAPAPGVAVLAWAIGFLRPDRAGSGWRRWRTRTVRRDGGRDDPLTWGDRGVVSLLRPQLSVFRD